MAKVRVYEFAKENGLESKEVLQVLKDMGEFVRSASSTIEAPVVRRLSERINSNSNSSNGNGGAASSAPAGKAAARPRPPAKKAAPSPSAPDDRSTGAAPSGARPGPARPAAPAARDDRAGAADAAPRTSAPRPGAPGSGPRPAPRAPESRSGEARPGPARDDQRRDPRQGDTGRGDAGRSAPRPRPGSTGGLPGAPGPRPRQGGPRQSGPRPGNNPFASSQGMGRTPRRPDSRTGGPGADGPRPGGPRPGGGSGAPGMPRPNPAMMPKQSALGAPSRGRPGAGPGRGRGGDPGGSRGPGGPGGPGGGPPMGPGRGRGGRGGTQGAFGRGGQKGRGRKSRKQRRQEVHDMEAPTIGGVRVRKGDGERIRLRRGASLTDLAERIGVDAAALVQVLFNMGEMVTATQSVNDDTLQVLGTELNYDIEVVSPEDEDRELLESFDIEFGEDAGDDSDLEVRPPVVTVMGHVDHGKTKLLDALRQSNVVAGEAGGITQAIGAYQVSAELDGVERKITFIDTPGHEAFTAMRARGAKSTDIAVLVVAADDGVMPQTIEALNHATAADLPVVVAVNKIDKEGADPSKVRGQLTEYGLVPEEYGGETMFVDVSAVTGQGLDDLQAAILLTADASLELRANPDMEAQGVAIEAHLDRGRGPVATVLVQRGTLRVGDSIVCGPAYGRVRAMLDDNGESVDEAPPSMPVQVIGLTSVPGAGDTILTVSDDRTARQIADQRESRRRAAAQAAGARRRTLDQLFEQMERGETSELLLILKGDGAGSVEALEEALSRVDVGDEVSLRVIDRGVGAITETNVSLAAASGAVIIGFNVRAQGKATEMADRENVDIRYYSVIYDAIDEIEAALRGMLKPIYEEVQLGTAEVRQVFRSSRAGVIAGSLVTSGIMRRNAQARVLRDGVVITDTTISSLRRERDDATEVREGYECGMTLANYSDIRVDDVIQTYEMQEKPRD